MPNMQDRKAERFSRFDAMSTEELQAFLREDASKPMGEESDTEAIFYVMEVLAKRRKEQNEGKPPVEALESFKQNYHTENETPYISESVPVVRKQSNSGRWKRGLVAAVAAICIFVIDFRFNFSNLIFGQTKTFQIFCFFGCGGFGGNIKSSFICVGLVVVEVVWESVIFKIL